MRKLTHMYVPPPTTTTAVHQLIGLPRPIFSPHFFWTDGGMSWGGRIIANRGIGYRKCFHPSQAHNQSNSIRSFTTSAVFETLKPKARSTGGKYNPTRGSRDFLSLGFSYDFVFQLHPYI